VSVPSVCPKCGGEMGRGFCVEYGIGSPQVETWAEGSPVKAWTGEVRVPWHQSEYVPIATFRCKGCGYLESYARPEFGAK